MKGKAGIVIVIAALMLASCQKLLTSLSGAAVAGAEFRALAQNMYASLEMPSCDPLKGFDRREHLKAELDEVRRFEAQVSTTPAWSHLEVAREDARYRIKRGEGCRSDSSRDWAEQNVAMTKEQVRATLPRLKTLTPSLPSLPEEDNGFPAKAPEFRYLARGLLIEISPLCRVSASGSNEDILRPASEATAKLKEELAGTPFANQFAIAEADVAYVVHNTLVECAEPSNASPQQISLEIAAEAKRQIAAIRSIATSM